MAIETKLSEDGNILVIKIKGKFDFSLLNEFRQTYCDDSIAPNKYIVDMRDADRKSTSLNSSHVALSRMPSSA